ncbi:SDR family NAD(P)-dependent oxidoreductase [Streptomyces antibioticus]|uniref:SDR family NAD(P)-dependent oxidoreductase n=1 Tax=Streptomyces antibioticus TaxID=1890 RepID=UPI002251F17D|nr:SDR family NAD(P)-dependent oxidoreductase [Streptomyces antibioticus]MCX4740920.1 SDR family NAD(P)-dependent oxidoreductase [Streptomyces antibioticus]MCX5173676.1 SDR family NAD(P)-dependent oxidoreductase [Streptomyces antibioticus]
MDAFVPELVTASIVMNGQFCCTGSRVLVQRGIAGELRTRPLRLSRRSGSGPPTFAIFENAADVTWRANATGFGLAAALYTHDDSGPAGSDASSGSAGYGSIPGLDRRAATALRAAAGVAAPVPARRAGQDRGSRRRSDRRDHGAATAREMVRRGFHVLAGVRRDSDGTALRAAGIEPVILDITNWEHIAALVARVDGDPRHRAVRVLFNNAGLPCSGPVEVVPLDTWRRVFDVNVFGTVALTQALLPALVRSKGRVVNISSMNGRVSMSDYGVYAGSKHAVEALSDALRTELAPYGVQVVIVEPGGVKTEMARVGLAGLSDLTTRMSPEQNERYGTLMQAIPYHVAAFTASGTTSDTAARKTAKAATDRKPRTRYTIGAVTAFLIHASNLLPDRMFDRLTMSDLRKHYPDTVKYGRTTAGPRA